MASNLVQQSHIKTVKSLVAESPYLKSIPANYIHTPHTTHEHTSDPQHSIPTIDFSLLTSLDSQIRSKAILDLGNACHDWGFFMVVNHGVSEALMKSVLDGINDFFNLTEEEKLEFAGKDVLDPIRCGTSFNTSKEKTNFWRDYLKVLVHADFHFPSKPHGFSEVASEYIKSIRDVARGLLKAISTSLGLEESSIEKVVDLNSSLQVFIANLYPICPQPELALGFQAHSDHGLLTLLIENGVGGLQIQHNGNWVNVKSLPNSFLVNTGDHLEILSNGRYKSIVHRVVVNKKAERISLAIANGPSPERVVKPMVELVDENNPPKYRAIRYKEFMRLQQSNQLDGKSILDRVRIQNPQKLRAVSQNKCSIRTLEKVYHTNYGKLCCSRIRMLYLFVTNGLTKINSDNNYSRTK